LILTDAADVKSISEHRDELRGAYRIHLPPHDVVVTLASKARFHEFAVQRELPVPHAVIVRRDTPLAKLSTLSFPVIVKVSTRASDGSAATEHFHIVTLKDAEAQCMRLLESVDEVVVEEWIEGPDSNVCFAFFHCGREPQSLKIFTGRKVASGS